ncbi:unnamed protein product [Moneuplotes crassus]|uniref:RING-type domain-containing protein n=1 Tax=Euplotes crassus TaxID=5936 RepID=A0AAD1X0M9_EUPCR|nr:unnamed protein product [Moneuplotes crassus]
MIVPIFTFFHLYFDIIFGNIVCTYCIFVNIWLFFTQAKEEPLFYFLGPFGLILWVMMYMYFMISSECLKKQTCTIQALCGCGVSRLTFIKQKETRYVTYLVIIIYILAFTIGASNSSRTGPVMAMFAFTCVALVIDIFLAVVKISLFLLMVLVIYLFALCICSEEKRAELFENPEPSEEDESEESSLELEEYTVNGSDSEEEEKDQQYENARRFRIRRRANNNQGEEVIEEKGISDLLTMIFQKGKKRFGSNKKKKKEQEELFCPICRVAFEDKDEVIELKCSENHIFHEDCIKDWLVMKQDCPLCRKEVFEMSYSDSIQEESVANEVESSRSQQPNRAKNKVKNKNDLRYVKELIKENAELDKYSDQTENRDFTNNFSGKKH